MLHVLLIAISYWITWSAVRFVNNGAQQFLALQILLCKVFKANCKESIEM
jgi:hypothetical protein